MKYRCDLNTVRLSERRSTFDYTLIFFDCKENHQVLSPLNEIVKRGKQSICCFTVFIFLVLSL